MPARLMDRIDLPAAGISLVRPRGRPSHDRRGAVGAEVLIEHRAVPVSEGEKLVKSRKDTIGVNI